MAVEAENTRVVLPNLNLKEGVTVPIPGEGLPFGSLLNFQEFILAFYNLFFCMHSFKRHLHPLGRDESDTK